MAWGLMAMMAAAVLLGATFAVTGVQLARGRWKHVIAGASHLSEREIERRVESQTARVLGALLVIVGAGVALFVGVTTWTSYTPENDVAIVVAGIAVVLVDLFVIWAFRAARQEVDYNSLVEERGREEHR